jgi:hypothetical protein
MYHLIGSDGRQYGPATLEQLQRWVAEGRVNNRTLVRPEGAADWRPLAEWTGQAPPPLPPMTAPPPLPAMAGVPALPDVGDDARVGWLRRHFRRHERRSPGDYLWRVTLEAFLIAMAVAILLSLMGVEDRDIGDLGTFAVAAILVAPWLETLLLQMLPVGLARLCGAGRSAQLILSMVVFAVLHFMAGLATGLAAGIVSGFYLAFTYTHWRRHSRTRAFLMTTTQHMIHNTAAVVILLAVWPF